MFKGIGLVKSLYDNSVVIQYTCSINWHLSAKRWYLLLTHAFKWMSSL